MISWNTIVGCYNAAFLSQFHDADRLFLERKGGRAKSCYLQQVNHLTITISDKGAYGPGVGWVESTRVTLCHRLRIRRGDGNEDGSGDARWLVAITLNVRGTRFQYPCERSSHVACRRRCPSSHVSRCYVRNWRKRGRPKYRFDFVAVCH